MFALIALLTSLGMGVIVLMFWMAIDTIIH